MGVAVCPLVKKSALWERVSGKDPVIDLWRADGELGAQGSWRSAGDG
jgi:hypothetical protein